MKELSLLTWLTQLGLSVALPLAGFVLGALWLQRAFCWDGWVIWAGLVLGLFGAANGFRRSLRAMELLSRDKEKKDEPPAAFNEHI